LSKPVKQSLLSEIRSEKTVPSGRIPRIQRVLEGMDEADRKELVEALDDYTIPAPTISKVLQRRGIDLDAASINKYRRGEFAHVIKG
jgi:hypothetical protein